MGRPRVPAGHARIFVGRVHSSGCYRPSWPTTESGWGVSVIRPFVQICSFVATRRWPMARQWTQVGVGQRSVLVRGSRSRGRIRRSEVVRIGFKHPVVALVERVRVLVTADARGR